MPEKGVGLVMRVSPASERPAHAQNSHGGDVLSREGVGGVADKQACLAHGSARQEVREDSGHGPCPTLREVSQHLPGPLAQPSEKTQAHPSGHQCPRLRIPVSAFSHLRVTWGVC